MKIVKLLSGLRVSESEEISGLDITQHGEIGYIFEAEMLHVSVSDARISPTELLHQNLALKTK